MTLVKIWSAAYRSAHSDTVDLWTLGWKSLESVLISYRERESTTLQIVLS